MKHNTRTETERRLRLEKKPPAPSAQPYPALTNCDEYTERKQLAFAMTHVTNAITGLRLCRTEVATGYAVDMLDEHIAILTDMLSDLHGWKEAIAQSVADGRGNSASG